VGTTSFKSNVEKTPLIFDFPSIKVSRHPAFSERQRDASFKLHTSSMPFENKEEELHGEKKDGRASH